MHRLCIRLERWVVAKAASSIDLAQKNTGARKYRKRYRSRDIDQVHRCDSRVILRNGDQSTIWDPVIAWFACFKQSSFL